MASEDTLTLYVDESGETGEITMTDANLFNFILQPYYVLAGISITKAEETVLTEFLATKTKEHRIMATELKAKNLYEKKSNFIIDLINFLTTNNIPAFLELMDKKYFLNSIIVQYTLMNILIFDGQDEDVPEVRQYLAEHLSDLIPANDTVLYHRYIEAAKTYTQSSLISLYDFMIDYFRRNKRQITSFRELSVTTIDKSITIDLACISNVDLKDLVQLTKNKYKEVHCTATHNLTVFLPGPDPNPHGRHIHLLPNYAAFTNLVARNEKYRFGKQNNPACQIVHDTQKQYDVIYKSAFEYLKQVDEELFEQTGLCADMKGRVKFKIDARTQLTFEDSQTNKMIQVADVLAGVMCRFWIDFQKNDANNNKILTYLPAIKRLCQADGTSDVPRGINLVIPATHRQRLNTEMKKLGSK
jgi:hypothetical protein